jgi:hypothetical protein
MQRKVRQPIPDPHTSYTHSCNNLASYEPKRRKYHVPSHPNYSKAEGEKKEYSTSINELKTFARPNLDEGNRFFQDNLNLVDKFGPSMVSEIKADRENMRQTLLLK